MSKFKLHQWFVPGEGIDRIVISGDIQRYLGDDATVRPGIGTGEYEAYRNLTSAMVEDLRADSAKWRAEQRRGRRNDDYVGSSTYHDSKKRIDARREESPRFDDRSCQTLVTPVVGRPEEFWPSRPSRI
ncbi:hypothetical protein K470DRAFT_113927 [Piedraia hortae CBS 480.64]|uniref:Uncharacterized protein n=1 Tax=Piedraia hortae CBS 480.64 TaxID=1314780 RepID=A0A6A7BV25_9PEZI|nr:hypothetical protein K470DRAFT_113927 [Piedraia hortae CBS 480.64]